MSVGVLLLNLLFAALAFLLVRWISDLVNLPSAIGVIVALIIAVIVFVANWGSQVVR